MAREIYSEFSREKMLIFHSYVKLPDGILMIMTDHFSLFKQMVTFHSYVKGIILGIPFHII